MYLFPLLMGTSYAVENILIHVNIPARAFCLSVTFGKRFFISKTAGTFLFTDVTHNL